MSTHDDKPEFTEVQTGGIDLSHIALEFAAVGAGIPSAYTLVVGPYLRVIAMVMLRKLQGQQANNPLCPFLNLRVDETLGPNSWYLETPAGNYGSRGC